VGNANKILFHTCFATSTSCPTLCLTVVPAYRSQVVVKYRNIVAALYSYNPRSGVVGLTQYAEESLLGAL